MLRLRSTQSISASMRSSKIRPEEMAQDIETTEERATNSLPVAGGDLSSASESTREGYAAMNSGQRDWVFIALASVAVFYALFAGLRTTADFDLGWQLATGRYILQHHAIPSADVFSYTANGKPWIYPPFGGVILYLLARMGGFAALSWLGALACASTAWLCTRQGSRAAAALAIVAVPAEAFRTLPRSELFTTVLFAAFLLIFWRHFDSRKSALWALPLLMLVWVNLHVGFVAGLAVIGAYLIMEASELPFAARRAPAIQRVRTAAPWLALSVIATLANAWGWNVYRSVFLQNSAMSLHSQFIGEWSPVHFSWAAWLQALSLRDPAGADWWMLGIAAVAIVTAFARKEIGAAVILSVGAYEAVKHLRMQGLFALLVCIVGGAVLERAIRAASDASTAAPSTGSSGDTSVWNGQGVFLRGSRATRIAEWAMVGLLVLVAITRVADLVSDRYYLFSDQISLFGAGESWWFPEKATDFLLHENLPANVFGDYNLGGYLTWKIGQTYPDYFDGRFLPFGESLFARHAELVGSSLDSADWQQEADARDIQTAIFSTSRFGGLTNFPLQEDCMATKWAPVYLDDVAAIFVRNTPANAALIQRLGISCHTITPAALSESASASAGDSRGAQATRYEALMNRASIFYVLERDKEAWADIADAEKIDERDPDLHLLKAQLAQAEGNLSAAEQEFTASLQLRPTDSGWFSLAELYASEKKYDAALDSLRSAISLSDAAYDRYRALGKLYLLMGRPSEALSAFREAERSSPFHGGMSAMGSDFNARVSEGEAAAYKALGDFPDAVVEQRAAVAAEPDDASRWQALGDLSVAAGQLDEAVKARQRAAELAAAAKAVATTR
jgi:tetratricopeptide (TPR) repeat protein